MDYMERVKRKEAPLIESAYQQRLVKENILHEQKQKQEIELSRQHHAGDLQEKNRLARMLENKVLFQSKIVSRREAEFNRLKKEKEDKINQVRAMRRQERETKRKLLFYLKTEEERLNKLREEEEAWKREEAERMKREEAERKAKLDEIAEKQRQRERELEQNKRLREALLGRLKEPMPSRSVELVAAAAHPVEAPAAAAAAAPTSGKYVPRFRLGGSAAPPSTPPPEPDRWGGHGNRLPLSGDSWRSDDQRSFSGGSQLPPPSSTSWSSSRSRG